MNAIDMTLNQERELVEKRFEYVRRTVGVMRRTKKFLMSYVERNIDKEAYEILVEIERILTDYDKP
jgi:hypothetical protein